MTLLFRLLSACISQCVACCMYYFGFGSLGIAKAFCVSLLLRFQDFLFYVIFDLLSTILIGLKLRPGG